MYKGAEMREIRFKNSQDASMYNKGYEQGKADMLDKIILAEKSKFYCDELSCNEFKNCSDCMVKYLEELKEHNNGKE